MEASKSLKTEKKVSNNCERQGHSGEEVSLMEEAHSRRERGQDLKDVRTRSCKEGQGTDSMSGEKKKPLSS